MKIEFEHCGCGGEAKYYNNLNDSFLCDSCLYDDFIQYSTSNLSGLTCDECGDDDDLRKVNYFNRVWCEDCHEYFTNKYIISIDNNF